MGINHTFVSAIPDDAAAVAAGEVVPSKWNADHGIIGTLQIPTSGTANYLTLGGSATGNPTTFTTAGSDANVDLDITLKGFGNSITPGSPQTNIVIAGSQTLPPAFKTFITTGASGMFMLGGLPHITMGGANSIGGGSSLNMVGSRGTLASPTKSLANDTFFEFLGWGYNDTDSWQSGPAIFGSANADWAGAGNESCRWEFWTSAGEQMTLGATGGKDAHLFGSLKIDGNVGFYTTTPIAKPTVTGAKGGNAALASLMTALANLGLVVDSTT